MWVRVLPCKEKGISAEEAGRQSLSTGLSHSWELLRPSLPGFGESGLLKLLTGCLLPALPLLTLSVSALQLFSRRWEFM